MYIHPCKPQFYYLKLGCKEVYNTQTCFHDADTESIDLKVLCFHTFCYFRDTIMCTIQHDDTECDNF